MRTYDKLIATICTGQGSGGLRSPFGWLWATGVGIAGLVAVPQALH